jgi:hypothetical protein
MGLSNGRALGALPVPPLEEFRIMLSLARKIHGASEDIEYTSIDGRPPEDAEPLVQMFRIGATELRHLIDAEVAENLFYPGPDTGNPLQIRDGW